MLLKVILAATYHAYWSLPWRSSSEVKGKGRSNNKWVSHYSSQVVETKGQYLASEKYLEMVLCLFDFHEMRESSRNKQ